MSLADAAPRPSLAARIVRTIGIAWIFLAAGPPIGTVFFLMMTAVIGMGRGIDVAGLSWIALFSLIYGLPFGYMIGFLPALGAGLIVGGKQAWFGPASIWFAMIVGIAVGVCFLAAAGQSLWTNGEAGNDSVQFNALLVVTTAFSTLCCWAMIRRWHLPPQNARARDSLPS